MNEIGRVLAHKEEIDTDSKKSVHDCKRRVSISITNIPGDRK